MSLDDKCPVFRNPDGTVEFPSRVPPIVESPNITTPGGTLQHHTFDSFDQQPDSALPVLEEGRGLSAEIPRPNLKARQWLTERPQPTARASALPRFKRRGTNASQLDEAVRNRPFLGDDSSSSSSSSSEDEEEGEDKEESRQRVQFKPQGRAGANEQRKGEPKQQRLAESGRRFGRFSVGNGEYKTRGKVSKKDGRLNISVNETSNSGYLAKALGASFLKNLGQTPENEDEDGVKRERTRMSRESSASTLTADIPRPTLNIVVMVIGSRGDIQPFLKLGKVLKEEHGHRVRIATHPAFRDFVQKDSGLEFFSVGGDPAELMAFMVKNPGMIPKLETVKAGEIGRRRDQMREMFEGFWRACINATDDEHDLHNLRMMGDRSPFVADAIIANPPSFAHVHCAERLGIPLHLMFTFPYTPTQAFPHPLANIKKTNVDPGYTNFMSYPLVEMMTWQGLGDLVNSFRVKTLGLEPVSTLWAPGQLYRLKVPYTYLWSPGLVPKPKDWGPEIDIAGFVFLDLASSFEPPEDLVKFLDAGEPPIYLGFGSIVVDDPDRFTKMIFEAVEEAGVRALVSKGWGGLGDDNVPEGIFMLDNTPHDWLFPKVKAVVHHGGAGTTAIGLKCGKPTMVVPFFGDQMFWGSMIGKAGAGANPVPYKQLTKENLAAGICQLLTDEAQLHAEEIAKDIEVEGDGAKNAVESFHRSLVLRGEHSMRCSILEDRVAVWNLKKTNLRLSALAADILVQRRKVNWRQLRLIRHSEWNDFEGPGEPLTGGATAMMSSVATVATGIGSIPFRIAKSSKRRQRHEVKKKERQAKKEARRAKHSGSGSKTMVNGSVVNGSDNRLKLKGSPSNHRTTDFATGTAETVPDAELEKTPSPTRETDIDSKKPPATGQEKVANGADVGPHTHNGESRSPLERTATEGGVTDGASVMSADPEQNAAEEILQDVGDGVAKSGEALARAPMDLSLAVAQGFHNAPRLYGDTTVRRPTRITGIQSGLKAAGSEFVFGVYDGISGVVTLPYRGARDGGVVGLGKGVGMGLTGLVLKTLSAVVGPVGYSLKGVHKEIGKRKQPTRFIRKARIMQGQRDLNELTPEEKKRDEKAVEHGWSVVQQVWEMMYEEHGGGIGGRVRLMKERKTWKASGAFENVEMAEKALKARKNGESLDGVFQEQREEIKKAHRPRKLVVDGVEANDGDEELQGEGGAEANGEMERTTLAAA